jgi:hypothetical protein
MIHSLDISREDMHVDVTVGVQNPEAVDSAAVAKTLPYGQITVKAVSGGQDVPTDTGDDKAVIATAAIFVRVELP